MYTDASKPPYPLPLQPIAETVVFYSLKRV